MKKFENDLLKIKLENLKNKIEKDNIFTIRNITEEDKKNSFTFVVYCLQKIRNNYELNNEIYNSITDGIDDNNIDIFDITENDDDIIINIAQIKYKSKDSTLSETIGTNEIRLFENSIENIIIKNNLNYRKNNYLKEQIENYNSILNEYKSSNIKINLFLITNGSILCEKDLDNLKNFRKKDGFNIISSYEFYNDYNFFIEDNNYIESEIEIKTVEKSISFSYGGISAYIGNIKAFQLYELFNTYGKQILAKNIRNLLKSDINKDIEDSIINNPELFWYKNNGISIICEKVEQKFLGGENKLILKKPFIINGGQTTKILYNLYNKLNNSKIYNREEIFAVSSLLLRVYQTTDNEIIEQIIYGTNNQNKVSLSNKYSNNKFLRILQDIFKEKMNVFLILKEDIEIDYSQYNDFISYEYLFQLYCSFYLELPEKAKNNKTKLLKDNFEDVFNESNKDINDKFIYLYKLYKFVSNELKNINNKNLYSHGLFAILFTMSLVDKNIIKIQNNLDVKNILSVLNKSIDILEKVIKDEQNNNNSFSYNNFFKTTSYKNKINTEINNYFNG